MVVTLRSLKKHGGVKKKEIKEESLPALKKGLANLKKHLDIIQSFNMPVVVAVNRFPSDSEAEIDLILSTMKGAQIPAALSDHHARGG